MSENAAVETAGPAIQESSESTQARGTGLTDPLYGASLSASSGLPGFSGSGPVQLDAASLGAAAIQRPAQEGIRGSGHALPFANKVQQSVGLHNVSGIGAHTDETALAATAERGAHADVQADGGLHGQTPNKVHALADAGTSGGGSKLPHFESIQASFGKYDISGVKAHTGGAASKAAEGMGANAFATGNDVAFASGKTDMHTAAHEAAHTVQQAAGVQLSGGVGAVGDKYEQHADKVADKVVRGESAEGLLDEMTGGGGEGVQRATVQRKEAVQRDPNGGPSEADMKKEFAENFEKMFIDRLPDELTSKMNSNQLAGQMYQEGGGGEVKASASLTDLGGQVFDVSQQGVSESEEAMGQLGKNAQGWVNFGVQDADGKVTGPEMKFVEAMDKLKPLADLLIGYFKKTMDATKNDWAFWSGNPAKMAAAKSGAVSLEGSTIGGIFDDMKLPKQNMALWGAISRAYAQAALENMDKRDYMGFVGVGADREQSIYNAVEKPTFDGITQGKVDVTWYTVVPAQEAYTENPGRPKQILDETLSEGGKPGVLAKHSDRGAAVAAMQAEHARRQKIAKGEQPG